MDLRDRIANDDFIVNYNRPKRPTMPTLLRKQAYDLISNEVAIIISVREQYNDDMATYYENVQAYREAATKLRKEFKAEALEYVGLTDNPKADKIYEHAMDGTDGFREILDRLEELAELF